MSLFSIHTKGIIYAIQIVLLGVVIFFTVSFVSAQIPVFLAGEKILNTQEVSIFPHVPHAALPKNDTIIYRDRAQAIVARDTHLANRDHFLFADLQAMTLTLYADGTSAIFPIIAEGLRGSFFEVPSGAYMIHLQEERHYSLIEDIIMPWALALSGNYMVHGVPVDSHGTPLDDTYAGGGIRLATEDAKMIFNSVHMGMPVIVAARDNQKQTRGEYFKKIRLGGGSVSVTNVIPGLSAASALAADIETGQILFEKKGDIVHPIASVTKLMTALIATQTIDPLKKLIVDEQSVNTFGDTGRLRVGDIMEAKDFLYPLLLASSNDAAEVYAQHVQGFIDLMNKKANDLGLHATVYRDPTGLTPENISTARDIFSFLAYIYNDQRQLFSLTGLPQYTLVADNKLHSWKNATWPENDGTFLGGKFGYTTEARQTLAAVFGVTLSEHGARPIAIVLLGSRDRKRDVLRIIQYLRNNFAYGSTLAGDTQPISPGIHAGANIFEAIQALDGR